MSLPPAPSGAEFLDADGLYEVVGGERVPPQLPGAYGARLASWLMCTLSEFAEPRKLGEAVCQMLFRLPLAEGNCRRPDVAFVSAERVRASSLTMTDEAWPAVPDLAVEVIGPNELAECVAARIADYFRAGVRVVWVVSPRLRLVHVFKSLTQVRGLQGSDAIDGGPVLPSFKLPVSDLFPTLGADAADATAG